MPGILREGQEAGRRRFPKAVLAKLRAHGLVRNTPTFHWAMSEFNTFRLRSDRRQRVASLNRSGMIQEIIRAGFCLWGEWLRLLLM